MAVVDSSPSDTSSNQDNICRSRFKGLLLSEFDMIRF